MVALLSLDQSVWVQILVRQPKRPIDFSVGLFLSNLPPPKNVFFQNSLQKLYKLNNDKHMLGCKIR